MLVADDEPAIVETIRDILEGYGFRVVTAANGSEARRLVEEAAPEVVLLDMNMPVLDGEGFVAAVRERGLRIPIVIMTATVEREALGVAARCRCLPEQAVELANLLEVTNRFATNPS